VRGLVLLVSVVALAAAGCDTGSDSDSADEQQTTTTPPVSSVSPPGPAASSRVYTKADLRRVGLQPSDAPRGMRYAKAESGPKQLDEIGILLDTQTKELRSLGFRAVYDVIFDGTKSDLRLASRIWLFSGARGAQRWLDRTEGNSLAVQLQPISAPTLADGSWAAGGNLNGNDLITHAFRVGNVVVVQTLSTQTATLSQSDALAAAQRAAARAQRG
jgi:hypothetical protein